MPVVDDDVDLHEASGYLQGATGPPSCVGVGDYFEDCGCDCSCAEVDADFAAGVA
jgi:hypothetical protein